MFTSQLVFKVGHPCEASPIFMFTIATTKTLDAKK